MTARSTRTVALAGALAILSFAACSDSTDANGTAQDFTGTYTLVSFSTGVGAGVIEIPGTTGTATLTATAYDVSLDIPGQGAVVDEGVYTATGTATSGTWTQQSTLDNTLQYSGTYTYNTTTDQLTLDATAQGIRTVIVLQKN